MRLRRPAAFGTGSIRRSYIGDFDGVRTGAHAGGTGDDNSERALIFFLVSIVAGIFGFTGISAASADVARFLFYVFVVIFLVLLILGLTIFRV